ncbi:MAG: TIGR04282 family arsenosugar biosynthesis glycosyltransferase [Chromatiaceae bacterium]|nr:TIGR04282 family arsenosugar biosynthesis glycosyltransferase [Chromatiaceae bacterium]
MTAMTGRRLLIFGRDPKPGRVKTRLIPALGAEGAAALYWRLLCGTLNHARATRADGYELWLDEAEPQDRLRTLAQALDVQLRVQPAGDLGTRMHMALCDALRHAETVVLIGSDCAEWPPGHIEAAFAALLRDDVVIGPAADGGYLLIGLRQPQPALFEGIHWGDEQVLAETRRRLRGQRLRWSELTVLRDLDRPSDLAHFTDLGDEPVTEPADPPLAILRGDTLCNGSTDNR